MHMKGYQCHNSGPFFKAVIFMGAPYFLQHTLLSFAYFYTVATFMVLFFSCQYFLCCDLLCRYFSVAIYVAKLSPNNWNESIFKQEVEL